MTVNLKPNAKVIDLASQLAATLFLQILSQKKSNPDNQELIEWQQKLEGQANFVRDIQDLVIQVAQEVIDENDACSECEGTGYSKLGMTKACRKCETTGRWLR